MPVVFGEMVTSVEAVSLGAVCLVLLLWRRDLHASRHMQADAGSLAPQETSEP